MAIIPVWQQTTSGIPETNLGPTGSPFAADFWASQGIFSTDNRPVIVEFRGDKWIIGGYTRPVFRLSADKSWYPAGIVPPFFPVGLALSAAATGINGTCLGYITFVQKLGDRVVQESNPSNVVDAGTMAGHQRVWTNIQNTGAEYHVTHVRGYVSMDGADYRMAWEAPYGVTTITESVPTTRLSHNGPDFDHNIPPSGLLYGHAFAGRMFYANTAQYPYRLWFSKAGFPQYVPEAYFRDTFGREPITGLWQGRNELVVFCLRNSYLVRQFGSGENDFVLERLDSNVGCITHHAIQEIHNRLWFPSEDGIWLYDGAFHYLMPDLRKLWQTDFTANRDAFLAGFAAQDRINKVYIFFTNRENRVEWENTEITPGTVRYVGYYANFEPSMLGQERYPDWSLDFVYRFDSAALYNLNGEMLIASCDGIIRKQDSTDGDDDGDTIGKEGIIRTGHRLMYESGEDIQTGKTLKQLWAHVESESTAWELRCLGGDEDAWRQIPPDNSIYFWKDDVVASGLTQGLTIGGSTYIYTYCAKSVHFELPEKVSGRGFTFELRMTTPVGFKFRGFGGRWAPGPAARPPREVLACTYPTLVLDSSHQATVGPTVVASYDVVQTGPEDIDGVTTELAQSFAVAAAANINSVSVSAWRLGNPSGSVRAKIYAHSGVFGTSSVPTGAPLAVSNDRTAAGLPSVGPLPSSSWPVFTFPTPLAVAPGNYVLSFEYLVVDPTNHPRFGLEDVTGAGPGNLSLNTGGWAADATRDACFYVFGDLGATVTVDDLDEGSSGVAYWRLELLDALGTVVQSDEGTNPATVQITLDDGDVGVEYTLRVTAWDTDISVSPDWEPCSVSGDVSLTVVAA